MQGSTVFRCIAFGIIAQLHLIENMEFHYKWIFIRKFIPRTHSVYEIKFIQYVVEFFYTNVNAEK